MTFSFELLTIELHKHSQSWIGIAGINSRHHFFYIEWDYNRRIENIQILWLFDWHRGRI